MNSQKNPCFIYDFTIAESSVSLDDLKNYLRDISKKWVFQLEKGDSGYLHYQGRISTKVKTRLASVIKHYTKFAFHWSLTSNENKDNDFYATKLETRIKGPWKDTDKELFVPVQFRGILENLKPFQKDIWDSKDIFEPRVIDIIVDTMGKLGKSTISALIDIYGFGIDMPPLNDFKLIMEWLFTQIDPKNTPRIICFDLPRAMSKENLYGIISALEQIKKGCVFDTRYKGRKIWINSPRIWVFTNEMPHLDLLSADRWRIWSVVDDRLILGDRTSSVCNTSFKSSEHLEQTCLITDYLEEDLTKPSKKIKKKLCVKDIN